MALRVAFLERSAHEGRWLVGPSIVDPELEELTLAEWKARVVANGHDLDEVTHWRTFWWAVAAHRLAPDARVFAIYGHLGLAVSLVWESPGADWRVDSFPGREMRLGRAIRRRRGGRSGAVARRVPHGRELPELHPQR